MLSGDAAPDQPSGLQATYTYQESDGKMTLNIQWEVSIKELTINSYWNTPIAFLWNCVLHSKYIVVLKK